MAYPHIRLRRANYNERVTSLLDLYGLARASILLAWKPNLKASELLRGVRQSLPTEACFSELCLLLSPLRNQGNQKVDAKLRRCDAQGAALIYMACRTGVHAVEYRSTVREQRRKELTSNEPGASARRAPGATPKPRRGAHGDPASSELRHVARQASPISKRRYWQMSAIVLSADGVMHVRVRQAAHG